MAKRDTAIRKVGSTRAVLLTARSARALVGTGKYEYVAEPPAPVVRFTLPPEPPAPPANDLDSLTYWQLRKKAEEAGLTVEGRTKADYLAALRGSYLTRDMRAG